MGTNYYWTKGTKCEHCGAEKEAIRLHIGKSSAGWCFALRVYPKGVEIGPETTLSISGLRDWFGLFDEYPEGEIVNEHDEIISVAHMAQIITCRYNGQTWERRIFAATQEPWTPETEARFHAQNFSERGPNFLLRSRIGDNCTGHGEGTWDLFDREFS